MEQDTTCSGGFSLLAVSKREWIDTYRRHSTSGSHTEWVWVWLDDLYDIKWNLHCPSALPVSKLSLVQFGTKEVFTFWSTAVKQNNINKKGPNMCLYRIRNFRWGERKKRKGNGKLGKWPGTTFYHFYDSRKKRGAGLKAKICICHSLVQMRSFASIFVYTESL